AHAIPLTTNPLSPFIQNQPGTTFFRPLSKCGRIAVTYESVVRITNDPTNAEKAVLDPTIMCAPVHVGEEATARRRSVARHGPEHPAGCDAAADAREEGWQEGEKDEANRARLAPGRLPVDLSQREEV
ncbi:MAG: hypothetical protein Q9180_007171, partial [Flavoplaca navasiana]